jgi:NADH dehydrogenase
MQVIIVTGSSGFIGSHVLKELAKKYYLRCLVRANSKRIDNPNIEYFVTDFEQPLFKESTFKDVGAVIHLLSEKRSFSSDIFTINVEFTKRLVEESMKAKITRLIYLSSETVQLPGIDNYAQSKKLAEKEVMSHENHLILRPTVVYGANDNSNIGFLIKLIRRSPIIPLIGNGEQLIQPTSVTDLVRCIIAGLNHGIKGTHLIAGGSPTSYGDVVKIIAETLNKRVFLLRVPISICSFIANLFRLLKSPILQKSQVDNFRINRVYSMQRTEKLFDIKFSTPSEGIRKMMNE